MPGKITPEMSKIDRFATHAGLTFTRVEEGHSQCVLEVNESLMNPYGTLHGGAIFTMADSSMGFALASCLDEGEQCASLEMCITYLKAVTSGTLTCDTAVIQRSSRSAILESEIKKGSRIVAKALGTWVIYKKRD